MAVFNVAQRSLAVAFAFAARVAHVSDAGARRRRAACTGKSLAAAGVVGARRRRRQSHRQRYRRPIYHQRELDISIYTNRPRW